MKPDIEPYVLRHTAPTRFAESGCDVFTLARIAGHSSITITQRYVHRQKDAVERAFAAFALPSVNRNDAWLPLQLTMSALVVLPDRSSRVGTKLGTAEKPLNPAPP